MTTKKVFRQRLRTLARFIRRNPGCQTNLNMDNWMHEDNLCGTTMCAAGWATTIPEFNKAGLKMSLPLGSVVFEDYVEDYYGFEACREFFGVVEPFSPGCYISNKPKASTVSRRLYKAAKDLK